MQCTSYFDLGIYSEALRLIRFGDLNPFIPGRNIRIFNDHFDPILIPFSFFSSWIPAPFLGISIEAIVLLLCWFPFRLLRDRGKISASTAFFSYAFFLLNAATIDAVYTPFHPTTWGSLPLLFVFATYWIKDYRAMAISLFFLFCCREEFPLIGFPLGLLMIYEKERKWGLGVLLGSLFWCVFVFLIRPRWFEGEFMNYGSGLIQGFLANPFPIVFSQLTFGKLRMFLERTLAAMVLIRWTSFKVHLPHALKILFIASPLLLVRLASDHWAFHYGTAAIITFLFMVLPALEASVVSVALRRFSWVFLFVIFFSPVIKTLITSGGNRCPADNSRKEELSKAQHWIETSGKEKILTENNLAALQLVHLAPGQKVYTFGGMHPAALAPFDTVLLEQPPFGDPWPSDHAAVQKMIELWRKNPSVHVITDNPYLFLAEGQISPDRP